MSSFNPNATPLTPKDWRMIAVKNVIKKADSAPRDFVISVLLGFGVAGATGIIPIGIVIVGCGLTMGWRKNKQMDKNIQAIRLGCVAPFLDEGQFRKFHAQVGPDEIRNQLQWASEEELPMEDSADEFYAEEVAPQKLTREDRRTTEAIEVPATAVPNTVIRVPAASSTAEDNPSTQRGGHRETAKSLIGKEPIDPSVFMVRDFHSAEKPCTASAIICAAPRGGKGNTIQRCITRVAQLHPTAEVWAIDPKDDPAEDWYWEGCKRIYRFNGIDPDLEVKEVSLAINEFIKQWHASKAPIKILIIDECVTLKSKLPKEVWKWICDVIVSVSSSGPSRGLFIWALTQSAVNTDLGFTGGTKSSLGNIYLASLNSSERFNHMRSASRANFITAPCDESLVSQTGFVCHYGGEWYPVGINPSTIPCKM